MKKWLGLAVLLVLFDFLQGASIGLGVAYVAPDNVDILGFLSVRADIMCKIVPPLHLRVGLVSFDIYDGLKILQLGTGYTGRWFFFSPGATLCLLVPTPSSVKPYVPVGFQFMRENSDYDSESFWSLHGGLGAMFDLAAIQGSVEGGVILVHDYYYGHGTARWFYGQAGLRFPVGL